MENICIDLSRVSDIDPNQGTKIHLAPPNQLSSIEQSVLIAGTRLYAAAADELQSSLLAAGLSLLKSPKSTIKTVGVLRNARIHSAKCCTFAIGPSASMGGGIVLDISGGLYFSNLPEIGFFIAGSFGAIMNGGGSVTAQLYYIFGPPSLLSGDSIVVGIDVGIGLLSFSGFLIFSTAPFELIGLSFAIGMGVSLIPVDLTLQYSRTWTKKISP